MTSKQDVFEKIDFERQRLKVAGLSEHNIDVVFDSIKIAVDLMVKTLEQEQKTGQWINNVNGTYTCDHCGCKHSRSNYCPNCGYRMNEVEQ